MIHRLVHAIDVFGAHLAAIGWTAVALAAACHLAKMAVRTRAWRNIVAAAYPAVRVRWRGIFGAYAAGAAANAILPARGGDALKLYLAKRQVAGSTYPTLIATLAVETLVDLVLSVALLVWALEQNVLPGLDALGRLRSIDWSWAERHPIGALIVLLGVLAGAAVTFLLARKRVEHLVADLRAGGAILRRPSLYARRVVTWQLLDWVLRLATIYWLLRAFHLPANAHTTLLVQVTQSLSTVVPLTPAGIGTEQGLLVYVFSGKAAAAKVLSFSVGMKIVLMTITVAVGAVATALMLRTLSWRRALEAAESSVADARSGGDPMAETAKARDA
jgi:uncharacterized membrane protein YbhN (UPF0104 family)